MCFQALHWGYFIQRKLITWKTFRNQIKKLYFLAIFQNNEEINFCMWNPVFPDVPQWEVRRSHCRRLGRDEDIVYMEHTALLNVLWFANWYDKIDQWQKMLGPEVKCSRKGDTVLETKEEWPQLQLNWLRMCSCLINCGLMILIVDGWANGWRCSIIGESQDFWTKKP